MYRFLKCFSAAAVAAVMLCGCTEVAEESPVQITETTAPIESPYPVKVGSFVFEQSPETVGVLSPAITEIICELGYEDKILGRSSYCDYPESISVKNELGSAANPDADAIIEAAPELLITMSPIAKKDITAIEAAGTRVWIIPTPKTVDELYACYNDIAAVFGGSIDCAEAAEQALEPMKAALGRAEGAMGSFVYVMSPDLAVASDKSFAGNFLSYFGENQAEGAEKLSFTVDELLELDPEWLILPDYISKYELPEETAELSAVKNGKIVYLSEDVMARIERPTSRLEKAVDEVLSQIEEAENGENAETGEDVADDDGESEEE